MHPLGFLIALISRQQAAAERARRLPVDPLPPIDDATIRAWRAWAHGARPTTRPTAAQRPTSVPAYAPIAGTRADKPA
jgi:hypothetical protein